MESDSDSFYEESSSDGEQEGALHLTVEVNIEKAPESPPPQPESPLILPQPVPVGSWLPSGNCQTMGPTSLIISLELMSLSSKAGQ